MSEQAYQLPCPCGQVLRVLPEQAGTEFKCPQCGAAVRVPSLQELRRLEKARAPEPAASVPAPPALRSWSPWPMIGGGAVLLLAMGVVLWLATAPGQRANLAGEGNQAADSGELADQIPRRSGEEPPAQPGHAAAPTTEAAQAPAHADAALPAPLLPVEYLDAVDFTALTHSQEPLGAVLIKLARHVEQRTAAQDLSNNLAQAYQIQLLREQLELPDRRLGESLRLRRLADRLREQIEEATVLQTALDETRRGLERLIEVSSTLEDPARLRAISVENFRRRIEQQREEHSDASALEQLDDADKELAARRAERLEALLKLPDNELIAEYAQWIFREGWVERAADAIRDQHQRLSERFQVSAPQAEELLNRDEQALHDWITERRPAMIHRDLEMIVELHKRLVGGDLDDSGQTRLRELCVRWNLDPTEAPTFLSVPVAPMTQELDRRAAARIREELAFWLSAQFGETPFDGALPPLEEFAQRYQIEADVAQLKELADATAETLLEKHRAMVFNGWRRALEQLVELENTVGDAENLDSTALNDAGRAFREYLEHNVSSAELLLMDQRLPQASRPALEKVSAQLKALLEQQDRSLLETAAEAVRLRLMPGTAAELLDELEVLERLYECDRTRAENLLDAENEADLRQLARDATVRQLRDELMVAAESGTGEGGGQGAGLRQAVREKYGIRAAEARRLVALTNEELWQWNLKRMADVGQLPDEEVVARAEQILPQQSESPDDAQPSLEELGRQQREEIEGRLAELIQQFTVSMETGAPARPWTSQKQGEMSEAERVQRGLLQPFFQPYSRYLSDAMSELVGENAAEERPETGNDVSEPVTADLHARAAGDVTPDPVSTAPDKAHDVAMYFSREEPAPAWVGLLRNGLLQARIAQASAGAPAQLTLILPVEPEHLSSTHAAQRAFDRWYGVVRLIVRWALRHAAEGGSVRVRVFAFLNEYETCTLWLNEEPWQTELSEAPPPEGRQPIDLDSWRGFLAESRLEGMRTIDGDTDPQLVLIGRRVVEAGEASEDEAQEPAVAPFTLLGRPVEVQDLAVAYRAIFYGGHNAPYQSLDASRHPAVANANFGGDLEDTRLGKVLLDADLTFKFLTSGLDPFADQTQDRRSEFQKICASQGLPPFEPAYDRFANAQEGTEMLQVTRFWLKLAGDSGGEGVRFDWRASPTAVEVVHPFFLAEARKHVAGGIELPVRDLPPWTRQAIDHLNEHREAYEELYPVLEEVRSVGLLQALCMWMHNEGVGTAFDLDELLDEPTDFVPTPRTRLRGVFASVVDLEGNVRSFNCSAVVRRLHERPLELVAGEQFESFAYVAAASMALARMWQAENPTISQAYEGIYSRVVDAMAQLDQLPDTEANQTLEALRSELYNVAQRRWMVGCAWMSTGGIDLAVPPARRGRIDLRGRHSSRRRSGTRLSPRSDAKPAPATRRPRGQPQAKATKDPAEAAPEKTAVPAKQQENTDNAKTAAARAKKPELKLQRRGNRIRLQRRSGSRFSNDF